MHRISFEHFGELEKHISHEEVQDLVGVLFKGSDREFKFIGSFEKDAGRKRGSHVYQSYENTHVIRLCLKNIEGSVGPLWTMGGNHPAPNVRIAIAMVISHELQHANQTLVHEHFHDDKNGGHVDEFFKKTPFKSYAGRPAEREAREFVDENIEVIAGIMGEPAPYAWRKKPPEEKDGPDLRAIADDLVECEEVTLEDLTEELRSSGANNPKNMELLISLLTERGVHVVKP